MTCTYRDASTQAAWREVSRRTRACADDAHDDAGTQAAKPHRVVRTPGMHAHMHGAFGRPNRASNGGGGPCGAVTERAKPQR